MKQNIKNIATDLWRSMRKRSPEILTGIGIAGMVTSAVMAVKATPKALDLLETKKTELDTERLEPKEIIKTAWKCYIPATAIGCVSIGYSIYRFILLPH